MSPTPSARAGRFAALCLALLLATGCANLAPVKTYADETKKLAAAFDPMLAGAVSTCRQKLERKTFIAGTEPFNVVAVREQAKRICKPLEDANPGVAALNDLLLHYADTLAALANEQLPSYKIELDGLKASINGLKDGTEPILPPAKVGAVIALAEFLARLATQRAATSEIKNLLDQQEGHDAAVDALSKYATLVYLAYLKDSRTELKVLVAALDIQERTQPLAARYLKTHLAAEDDKLAALELAVPAFVASVEQMKSARAELRLKLDRPDDADLRKQLVAFAKEVRNLRKQLHEAF